MRRPLFLALLALSAPLIAAPMAWASGLTVPVDQSRRLPIGGSAANVVVGNTNIADVRAIDSRTLMIVGKKQGTTNVVVLDLAGRTLFDGEITVSSGGSSGAMTVYRGAEAVEYACSPYCQAITSAGAGPLSGGGAPIVPSSPAPAAPAAAAQ